MISDTKLTLGMVGENIAALHVALIKHGLSIPEDETKRQFFGPATSLAVSKFQQANSLEASGEVGAATTVKLKSLLQTNAADYNQVRSQTFALQNNPQQQYSDKEVKLRKQTHLSLFALSKSSGHPIAHMPFYAEVGVVRPLPQPTCNQQEAIREGIFKFIAIKNPDVEFLHAIRELVDQVAELLCDVLIRLLAPEFKEQWARDKVGEENVVKILQVAAELAKSKNVEFSNTHALAQLMEDAVLAYAKENNVPLANRAAEDSQVVWVHPMGVLATDHVGYLSFDLTRLPTDVADAVAVAVEARRRDPKAQTGTAIWLYPMAQEEARIDALEQLRFAHDAIVVKLELDLELYQSKLNVSLKNGGFLSLQNPDLTDWRLSPGSFATNPGALVGADGCELILPSNVALHDFNFYQVIGLPADEVQLPIDPTAAAKVRPGFINEYRLSFIPIGHALGQILNSMPLAPGESVNFAVIDWTRRDDAQRKEHTTLDEQLVHNEHRDRTISETVNAAIKEYQHGSNFTAGIAGSYGAALGASGMGAAIGLAGSLGGSTSNSSGTRDIAATTVQKLSDNITQASSAMRELHSTVVVHSTQSEHESIETRTVVNYNHSHTLTVLYYEVLRHFRVVTEFVGRRPALLTNIHGGIAHFGKSNYEINWQVISDNRKLLEAELLDERYKEGFEIAERQRHRERIAKIVGPPPTQPTPPPTQGPEFRFFTFDIRTGDILTLAEGELRIKANIDLNTGPWYVKLNKGERISPAGTFFEKGHLYSFVAKTESPDMRTIPWGKIEAIALFVEFHDWDSEADMSFSFLRVSGTDVDGRTTVLYEKDYAPLDHLIFDNGITMFLPTHRPPPLPPSPGRSAESIEEEAKFLEFNEHLLNNRAHYERALRLGSTTAQRAFELASLRIDGNASLLEKVDNRPLEVLGNYVAYPCIDAVWSEMIMKKIEALKLPDIEAVERLVTLPTRGVFAEAKLGHCNASEEIDENRFWRWDEHPIPHMAPEIAPIQGVTPQAQQQNVSPTPFPQSLVNIVNPPNAPDPTGLASAMNVLAASNIFRDMSGRAEVADLLKKLSDNSVAIAGVAQKAATGGAVGASSGGGGASGQSSANTGASAQNQVSTQPQQPPEKKESQQIENLNKKLDVADRLPPSQKKAVQQVVTDELKKPAVKEPVPVGLGFQINFQTAVYGNLPDGSATIEIVPFGQRTGTPFVPGTTIGPPTDAQITTISEKFDVKMTNGTIMIQTNHASAPGKVIMTVYFGATPNTFVQVIKDSDIYNASTGIFTLQGGGDYQQPSSGNVVVLNVEPKTKTKKITSKTAGGTSWEAGDETGAEYKVATWTRSRKEGGNTSGEKGDEYDVALMTGGLDFQQKNGGK